MIHFAPSNNTSVSRSLLAGLACGILAAILNVAYGYFYSKATGFAVPVLFEPLLSFVGFPLLFIIVGFIFFEMVECMKKGKLFFTILFLLLLLIAIILVISSYSTGMKEFLLGIFAITGLLLSLLLPFLATHARIFMDKEEFTESDET
jgi:hypothetical protein